jgi:endogenous inhibitor of DNA gyrase (YacG/DUF329 family)
MSPSRPARTVACPACGKNAVFSPDNPSRPFCSERCRLVDLGAWAEESYRIPVEEPSPGDESADANDSQKP